MGIFGYKHTIDIVYYYTLSGLEYGDSWSWQKELITVWKRLKLAERIDHSMEVIEAGIKSWSQYWSDWRRHKELITVWKRLKPAERINANTVRHLRLDIRLIIYQTHLSQGITLFTKMKTIYLRKKKKVLTSIKPFLLKLSLAS